MPELSGPQLAKLKSTHQRVDCQFVVLPTWYPKGIITVMGGAISWLDMVNIYPRHAWVANSGAIVLDGNDSQQHDRTAATGHVFTLEAGSGGLVDHSDGTATYTAPASGSGYATIELATDGSGQPCYAYVAYGTAELNVGEVTSFHADIQSGGWEMTVRAYGDVDAFDRNAGVLLKVDDYWNGSEDTFGGYKWSHGVFYGYVVDPRRVHEDHMHTYMEFTLHSVEKMMRRATLLEMVFATSGSGDDLTDASLKVLDPIWWVLMDEFNQRHNCWLFADTTTITNLKLSRGPMWDVVEDVAKRSFCACYTTRLGDFHVIPDADVRWWIDYEQGGSEGPPEYTNNLTWTKELFEAIDLEQYADPNPGGNGSALPDPPVQQVVLTGIQSDLSEIWARYPSDVNIESAGSLEKLTGLICEDAPTLETWAARYFHKVCGTTQVDLQLFLMHCVDLYTPCALTFTPDANRVTNTEIAYTAAGGFYVTSLDYTIDPGLGTWRGNVHLSQRGNQSPNDVGENSDD